MPTTFIKVIFMKHVRISVAFFLVWIILLTNSVTAFAQDDGTVAESITFSEEYAADLEMSRLAESGENKIALAVGGKTDFTVVLPDRYSETLLEAVETFQSVFYEMTGARISVISEKEADGVGNYICIDTAMGTKRPDETGLSDGYRTVVTDDFISICGATQAATRNGVYAFMEDVLGCMFLTPDDTYVPHQKTVWIDKSDTTVTPATQWRDVYAYETVQNKWAAKLRLNGIDVESENPDLTIEELQYEGWGTWCHNCYDYLSPDDYFEEHPEYFSEKDGVRVTTYEGRDAYLCLSNPEVFEIVKNSLAEKIRQNPEELYWDFSGSDNPALAGCECEKCKAADEAAGGTGMGTLLPFLNKLAKAFPDKYISTLAYLHTLKAPENLKAEPNVVIKLCSMPGDQASSYLNGTNMNAKEFQQQVEEWSKITDKIVVWDYVVNFAHLLMPFPNFAVQAKNQKFYEDNHIVGVFHQASREKGGEFACLRAYVLSRLMWEGSNMNVAECVSRYVVAYYGDAAPYILEYMNLCASELCRSGNALGLYDGMTAHWKGYLSEESIRKYQDLTAQAKSAVSGDSEMESRVEEIELSVLYAEILQPRTDEKEREDALTDFNALCEKHGITMVCEWDSLENFNKIGLKNTLSSDRKELMQPYVTGLIVAVVAVAVLVIVIITVVFIVKKKRQVHLS